MKIKPVVLDCVKTTHTGFRVDFRLDNNITFVKGDSGIGKSAAFLFLKELTAEDIRIKCFNYLDIKSNYKSSMKLSKGKLFVIDNADLLLDDQMREYIAGDTKNQYIIIGRNPKGLHLNYDEICNLRNHAEGEMTVFTIENESI